MNDLLAIDPGETVGYAWIEHNGDSIHDVNADQKDWRDFLHYLEAWLENNQSFRVLIENYTVRKNTIAANLNKELVTVKVIGVIEWLCENKGVEITFQPAGIGNAFFDKQRLKEMDLWVVSKKHARDAIRHGMWHLTFGRE